MLSAEGRSGGDEFSVHAVEQAWAGAWGNAGVAVMGLLCGRAEQSTKTLGMTG
jgi:hypothetical protein